jgi:hypothetical protein
LFLLCLHCDAKWFNFPHLSHVLPYAGHFPLVHCFPQYMQFLCFVCFWGSVRLNTAKPGISALRP